MTHPSPHSSQQPPPGHTGHATRKYFLSPHGGTTWIEAWTNPPGYLPIAPSDPWAEGAATRLVDKIPGPGTAEPQDLANPDLLTAAADDEDGADFQDRAAEWKSALGERVGKTDQDAMLRAATGS